MRWPASCLVLALAFSGCAGASTSSLDTVLHATPTVSSVLHREGAEDPSSKWTSRTWMVLVGDDPRPSVGRWHRSDNTVRSGGASWTFQDENVGRYHDATRYDLHSPRIDLGAAQEPTWRFYYRGESELGSGDEFSWMIAKADGTFLSLGSTDAPAKGWTEVRIDLAAYRGQTVELLLRFVADACGGDTASSLCGEGTHAGYFVDDIEVFDAA